MAILDMTTQAGIKKAEEHWKQRVAIAERKKIIDEIEIIYKDAKSRQDALPVVHSVSWWLLERELRVVNEILDQLRNQEAKLKCHYTQEI